MICLLKTSFKIYRIFAFSYSVFIMTDKKKKEHSFQCSYPKKKYLSF